MILKFIVQNTKNFNFEKGENSWGKSEMCLYNNNENIQDFHEEHYKNTQNYKNT